MKNESDAMQDSGAASSVRRASGRMVALAVLAALLAVPQISPPAAGASVADGARKWRAEDWKGAVAEWVKPAAEGNPDALFNMGQAYRLGRGVEQDRERAVEYYQRAAEKGHLSATANLGIVLFQDGKRTQALPYLRTAADRGDMRAAYVLGVATFNGDGAPRNRTLGYAYVIRARDLGLAEAGRQAGRMATLMTPTERARGEAAAAALAAGEPVPVELGGEAPARSAAAPAPKKDATPPPAAPAAAPSVAAPAETADGYYVQLGAFSNSEMARRAWATMVARSASILKGQTPRYAPKGRLTALQIGAFPSQAEARRLCSELSGAGHPCFVTRQ